MSVWPVNWFMFVVYVWQSNFPLCLPILSAWWASGQKEVKLGCSCRVWNWWFPSSTPDYWQVSHMLQCYYSQLYLNRHFCMTDTSLIIDTQSWSLLLLRDALRCVSVYFSVAKFQLVSCNLSLAMIWQMTKYSQTAKTVFSHLKHV